MHTLRQSLLVVAVCGGLLGILAADAWAQDAQQPQQGQQTQGQQNQSPAPQGQQNEAQPAAPIPAYHSPLASEAGDDQSSEQTEPLAPDTRPLSGAQILSLGSLENDHSYWQPHADVAGVFDTNPQEGPNTSSWGAWASFSGGVDLHQISGNSDLTLSYLGGATIASGANASNGVVQQLGIVEALTFRRWHLSLIDQLSYLPGSGFGFGGLGSAWGVNGRVRWIGHDVRRTKRDSTHRARPDSGKCVNRRSHRQLDASWVADVRRRLFLGAIFHRRLRKLDGGELSGRIQLSVDAQGHGRSAVHVQCRPLRQRRSIDRSAYDSGFVCEAHYGTAGFSGASRASVWALSYAHF